MNEFYTVWDMWRQANLIVCFAFARCGQELPVASLRRQHLLQLIHQHHRRGLQDPHAGHWRPACETAHLGHRRPGALPHHHLHVCCCCLFCCTKFFIIYILYLLFLFVRSFEEHIIICHRFIHKRWDYYNEIL